MSRSQPCGRPARSRRGRRRSRGRADGSRRPPGATPPAGIRGSARRARSRCAAARRRRAAPAPRARPRRRAGCRRRCSRARRAGTARGPRRSPRRRRSGRSRRRAPCRAAAGPARPARARRRTSCRCAPGLTGSRPRPGARSRGAERAGAGDIAGRRDDHAGLALDRLDQERDRVVVERRLERLEVPVRDGLEAGGVGAEVGPRRRVVGERDDRGRAAVEIAATDDDLRAAGRHPLDLVTPLARRLDRGLDGLGARVHRQHPLRRADLGEAHAELAEAVVAEGAAGEGQAIELPVRPPRPAAGGGGRN